MFRQILQVETCFFFNPKGDHVFFEAHRVSNDLEAWVTLRITGNPAKKRDLDVFFAGVVWISSPHQC